MLPSKTAILRTNKERRVYLNTLVGHVDNLPHGPAITVLLDYGWTVSSEYREITFYRHPVFSDTIALIHEGGAYVEG